VTKREVVESMREIDALLAKHDSYLSFQNARVELGKVWDFLINGPEGE
jgi:hypothetical protein